MEHTPLEPGAAPDEARDAHARAQVSALPVTNGTRDVVGVRFVDEASEEPLGPAVSELRVRVDRVTASRRGRLAEQIDDAIERELHARRAGPAGIGATRDADGNLSDQLFRARQVGATRIVVSLPKLAAIAGPGQALGADDSETLLFWARATRERPVSLRLDASDTALSAHVDPIPLRLALDPSRARSSPLRIPGAAATPEPAQIRSSDPASLISDPELGPRTSDVGPRTSDPDPARDPAPDPAPEPAADPDTWRTLTLALTAARGPQPLVAFERLFATSYLPLDTLLHVAHDASRTPDPRAVHARDDFRDNFSRVYLEAFHAFGATGKRPKMVLDAPDIAARIARQTSARTSQILLVDSMRYDLGRLVKDEVARAVGSKAALTSELILWSALPTTTTHQLATLTRGAAALAEAAEEEREDGALRGRTATTIRRVKIGSRDVYRLDLCDVRVREAAERVLPLMPSIANDVAQAIARHAVTLAPRTLLFVFGDHGFTLGRDGTPSSGGASPEEVLVPAFAFLIGEAH